MGAEQNRRAHWERVYEDRAEDEVSWFQSEPVRSLEMIRAANAGPDAAVIDVGGGASRLVDRLLEMGFTDLTVLDISAPGVDRARARLGPRAEAVSWIVADITDWEPTREYTLWHDRAVFHFLTDAGDRAAYRAVLEQAVPAGGHVIIATFGPDGPEKCSGLPVRRYGRDDIEAEFEGLLTFAEEAAETHVTPAGKKQAFRFFRFVRD